MMWKCCEGVTAVMHTRCDNESTTTCSDQVSLLGWNSDDYKVQRNPAYKDVTPVRKQNPTPRRQRTFRFQYMIQRNAPPPVKVAEVAWIQNEPSAYTGNEPKKAKEATSGLLTGSPIRVNKSGDLPRRQPVGSLIRLSKSFDNASVGEYRKKQVPPRSTMSVVDEHEFRGKVASNRSLPNSNRSLSNRSLRSNRSLSNRSLCSNRSLSNRSLYLDMTDEGNDSDASSPAKVNDASLSALSNQSHGDDVIPEKRGPPKTPKSQNVKGFLVENRVLRVARTISYLQLEIYYIESGWAFKTPEIVESSRQTTSAPAQLRAVWCT
jgi:hypothetical protein